MPEPHLSHALCSVCGGAMTVHEEVRGGVCAKPSCRHVTLLRGIAQRESAAEAALKQHIMNVRDTIIPTLGLEDPDAVAVAIVPATSRAVVPVPGNRKLRFRRYLSNIVIEALKQAEDEPMPALADDEMPAASQFDEEAPALRAACATCRGHCCRLGGPRNAFLDVATLRRVMTMRPDLQPREIVDEYMRRIPRESFQDSCVFHGASGCTLPRQMRARICNVYHCDGLRRLSRLYETPGNRTILIVARSETDAVRWGIFNRDGDT